MRTNLVIWLLPLTHIFTAQPFIFSHAWVFKSFSRILIEPQYHCRRKEKIEKQLKIVACRSENMPCLLSKINTFQKAALKIATIYFTLRLQQPVNSKIFTSERVNITIQKPFTVATPLFFFHEFKPFADLIVFRRRNAAEFVHTRSILFKASEKPYNQNHSDRNTLSMISISNYRSTRAWWLFRSWNNICKLQ